MRPGPAGEIQLTAGWVEHRCAANCKMLPENDSDGYHLGFVHRPRRVDGELRMCQKKVVLVNAAEPLPNLTFLT